MPRSQKNDIQASITGLVSSHVNGLVGALTDAIRHHVASEIQSYLTGAGPGAGRLGRRAGALRAPRILPCIAPGCKNDSKGPRYHYLCEDHKGATKKDYDAWRLARIEARKKAARAPRGGRSASKAS